MSHACNWVHTVHIHVSDGYTLYIYTLGTHCTYTRFRFLVQQLYVTCMQLGTHSQMNRCKLCFSCTTVGHIACPTAVDQNVQYNEHTVVVVERTSDLY